MARVNITTAGHTIEIDEDGVPAVKLAPLALRLWKATRDPKLDTVTGVGFGQFDRAEDFVEPGESAGLRPR